MREFAYDRVKLVLAMNFVFVLHAQDLILFVGITHHIDAVVVGLHLASAKSRELSPKVGEWN